jgi:integrase
MADEIIVSVNLWKTHGYVLRWTDPETGQRRVKLVSADNRKEAAKAAGVLEKELREGKHATGPRMAWMDFTWRYVDQVLPGLAPKTGAMVGTVLKHVEEIIKPKRLADVTAARLTGFVAELRSRGRAEATIKSYLAHLASILNWAVEQELMPVLPKMPKIQRAPKGSRVMKGRPIALEEFERMLGKVAAVVGEDAAASWKRLLTGLWWSGLRLGEALNLYWESGLGRISVDLDRRRPMLGIPGSAQKSGKSQTYPMATEFGEFLLSIPEAERSGRVFKLLGVKVGTSGSVHDKDWASKIIARIGKAAGVKVNTKPNGRVKFASAHDLRRSFGERWASRVMPKDLMDLMRHESKETTLRYYVGRNAETTADALWAAYENIGNRGKSDFGNKPGNKRHSNTFGE